jgi:hypothetical protein
MQSQMTSQMQSQMALPYGSNVMGMMQPGMGQSQYAQSVAVRLPVADLLDRMFMAMHPDQS